MDRLLTPNARQKEWLRRGLTAFLHFGMNTFTGQEWGDGTEDPKCFNPEKLDCRQWVRVLKEAGFGTAILTAKHHDGFCLWQSAYTEHSVKNSPFKNGQGDIVREFTDACREYGLKAGIYLSPWDRHEKTWGKPEYNDYYVNQLTELLTRYGEIWEVWWDGAGSTEAKYDWTRWATTVRRLQPNAVIFGSLGATPFVDVRWVGNERGFAGKPCWATIDASSLEKETVSELNQGKMDGNRFIPAEVDVSIRPGWFYKKEQDEMVRSPKNLVGLWLTSIGRNAGLLLNVPPDKNGLLADADVQSLTAFGTYIRENTRENLLQGAKVTGGGCGLDALTDGKEDTFFKASENEFAVEYAFEKPTKCNVVKMEEMLDFGHRVREYRVSALVGTKWKTLAQGECLGNACIEKFDEITATAVKFSVTKAVDLPCIRSFGVYRFEDLPDEKPVEIKGKNLLDAPFVSVKQEGNVIDINLGGVFPFNLLTMDGKDLHAYEVRIFNGTDFDGSEKICVHYDKPVVHRFKETVDYAYRIQIIVHDYPERKGKPRDVALYLE